MSMRCSWDGSEPEHGTAIMERVAGGKKLPPDVAERILANTEGVPLFVEELTQDGARFRPARSRRATAIISIGPLPPIWRSPRRCRIR